MLHSTCIILLALGIGQRLQQELIPAQELMPNDGIVRTQQRRRYAGELKRTTTLWARMAQGERERRAMSTTLLAGANSSEQTLPAAFSWRRYQASNGQVFDLLTPQRNQHIPKYCGSCWAFSATSVLADRWNVLQHKTNPAEPVHSIALSVQHVLSCGNERVSCGTCHGGDDAMVYEYSSLYGVPHDDCSSYIAQDMKCSANFIGYNASAHMESRPDCYSCDEKARCWAISTYNRLWSSPPYQIRANEQSIMQDIYEHGPIGCGIMATDLMEHGYGINCLDPPTSPLTTSAHPGTNCMTGTFQEPTNDMDARINHVVSIVGWGTDAQGNKYWTIRNSWGSEWGEDGFMNIVRDSNTGPLGAGNNLLEMQCASAHVYDFSPNDINPGPGAFARRTRLHS